MGTKALVTGTAQLTTSLLPSGSNKLRAYYTGGSADAPSLSPVVTQVVNSAPQSGFQSGVVYPSGPGGSQASYQAVTADFNGDGITDVAAVNFFGGAAGIVGIRLGNGNGTFGPVTSYTLGNESRSIAVGDFNNDGKADLVVGQNSDDNIAILLGNGDGTFQPPQFYGAGAGTLGPIAIAVGDFDGDGNADIATANNPSNTISILLGKGDGTFRNPGCIFSRRVTHRYDFRRFQWRWTDRSRDLRFQQHQNSGLPRIWWRQPRGGSELPCRGTDVLEGIATGDFNGDGNPDLITVGSSTDNVSLLLGSANGTFGAPTVVGTGQSNGSSASLEVGDFNGDHHLDVAVTNFGGNVIVLTGDGAEDWPPPGQRRSAVFPTELQSGISMAMESAISL